MEPPRLRFSVTADFSAPYRLLYHRQRGSDCTVLTATGLVNGEGQILTPYRIETPEPIDKKNCIRDYVHTKFGENPSTGGFWANRWNITLLTFFIYLFIYTFFSSTHLQIIPLNGFWRAMLKQRVFTQGSAFWGLKKLKLTMNPLLCPPNGKFWQKSGLCPKKLNRSKRP